MIHKPDILPNSPIAINTLILYWKKLKPIKVVPLLNRIMETFKFGDKVKLNDGREAIVQEDQENGSAEVKIMIEGDDYAHVVNAEKLERRREE